MAYNSMRGNATRPATAPAKEGVATTIQDSVVESMKRGGKTAVADQCIQELTMLALAGLAPEYIADERAQKVVRFAIPTILIGASDVLSEQLGDLGPQLKSAAELANDAAFRDLLQPMLPKLMPLLEKFASTGS